MCESRVETQDTSRSFGSRHSKNRFFVDAHVCVLFKIQSAVYGLFFTNVYVCVMFVHILNLYDIFCVIATSSTWTENAAVPYVRDYTTSFLLFFLSLRCVRLLICDGSILYVVFCLLSHKAFMDLEDLSERMKQKKKIVIQTTDAISVKRLLNFHSTLDNFIHPMASHDMWIWSASDFIAAALQINGVRLLHWSLPLWVNRYAIDGFWWLFYSCNWFY